MADGCQDFGSFSVFCFDPTEKAFGFPIHNQLGLFSSSSINMFLLPIFLVWCLLFWVRGNSVFGDDDDDDATTEAAITCSFVLGTIAHFLVLWL